MYVTMPTAYPDRPVETAVRSLDILERHGRSVPVHRVFCPRRDASIYTSACATCPFARAVTETAIICAPPGIPEAPEPTSDTPLFVGPDALALRTAVGAVCALHAVAVRIDVPIAQARRLLDRDAVVVVLTRDDQVHGILSAANPPEGLASLAETADSGAGELPESAPLVEAIELMLHRHVRLVSVTGDGRHFVGLVTDLDVLRWVARQRLPTS